GRAPESQGPRERLQSKERPRVRGTRRPCIRSPNDHPDRLLPATNLDSEFSSQSGPTCLVDMHQECSSCSGSTEWNANGDPYGRQCGKELQHRQEELPPEQSLVSITLASRSPALRRSPPVQTHPGNSISARESTLRRRQVCPCDSSRPIDRPDWLSGRAEMR